MSQVPEADMCRNFNLGIGLVFIIPEKERDGLSRLVRAEKLHSSHIGRII